MIEMKRVLVILICLIIAFSFLIGCGGSPSPPTKHHYTMEIHIQEPSVIQGQVAKKLFKSISKGNWWIDKPENGFIGDIGRSSEGNLNGDVEARAILKDELGNIVSPPNSYDIQWTSATNPLITGNGETFLYSSNTQGTIKLNAAYEGDIPDYNDPSIPPTHVNLSAEAILVLVYRNTTGVVGGQTDFFNMSTNQCLPNATGAEVYHTRESGIDYINAPFGIALILDPEIDPETSEVNGRILASVKSVPDALSYTNTKLPLTNYSTYIVQLSGGTGYAKVTAWMGTGSSIMWFLFSTSPDTEFSTHFGI